MLHHSKIYQETSYIWILPIHQLPPKLITPAAIGGLLWKISPQVPFMTAEVIGLLGTFMFIMTDEDRYAS